MFVRNKNKCLSIQKTGTGHKFCNFPAIVIDLAQMTLGKEHGTPSGHKQCLYEVRNSNFIYKKRYGLDTNFAQTNARRANGRTRQTDS